MLDLMSKNAILKTISLTQIGRKKFYRTAILAKTKITKRADTS